MGQHGAGIPGVDHAVVEQQAAGVEGVGLGFEDGDDLVELDLGGVRVGRDALAGHRGVADDLHGARRLLAAHHGCPGIRPAEQEAGRIATAAHAVIAGAKAGTALDRDLRHGGVRHRLDHLAAVLDHAALLALLANHVAGRVLQIDDGLAQLALALDEMRGLVGTRHIDRPVVADETDRMAFDAGLHAQGLRPVERLEFQQVGAVGQARHDLAHVDRLAQRCGHQAQQLLCCITGRSRTGRRSHGRALVPVQSGHHLAGDAQRLTVVFGQVLAQA